MRYGLFYNTPLVRILIIGMRLLLSSAPPPHLAFVHLIMCICCLLSMLMHLCVTSSDAVRVI